MLGGRAAEGNYPNLQVDGTLDAQTPIEFFKHFSEEMIVFVPTEDSDPEELRIRGFKPKSQE